MKLQIDFPEEINKNLKLAKAFYAHNTLQETVIDLCRKHLAEYIRAAKKKGAE